MSPDDFLSWLTETQSMSLKSARDIVSRYRRASRYVDYSRNRTVEETVFVMMQNEEFKKLSTSVRSQLKRAIRLHGSFVVSRQKPLPL